MAMHVEESELALTKIERGRNAARYVLFVHLAVAGSSIAATVLILLASSFANPRVGCYASITVISGACASGVYGSFAWFAWQWWFEPLQSPFSIFHAEEEIDHLRPILLAVAVLASISAGAPGLMNAVSIAELLARNASPMDRAATLKHKKCIFGSAFLFKIMMFAAVINLEMLQLIPWRKRSLYDFPTFVSIIFGAVGVLVGDLAQIAAQVVLVLCLKSYEIDYMLGVTSIGIATAIASIWSRGLRKIIIACCVRKPENIPHLRDEAFWAIPPRLASAPTEYSEAIAPRRHRGSSAMRLVAAHLKQQLEPFQQQGQLKEPQQTQETPIPSDPSASDLPHEEPRPTWRPSLTLPFVSSHIPTFDPVIETAKESLSPSSAPIHAAMRWLSSEVDQSSSELPTPKEPPASAHRGGVGVEGEFPHFPDLESKGSPSGSSTALERARLAAHERASRSPDGNTR